MGVGHGATDFSKALHVRARQPRGQIGREQQEAADDPGAKAQDGVFPDDLARTHGELLRYGLNAAGEAPPP
jgi:hypothetical protein